MSRSLEAHTRISSESKLEQEGMPTIKAVSAVTQPYLLLQLSGFETLSSLHIEQ